MRMASSDRTFEQLRPRLVTAPAELPVTLAEAKAQIRALDSGEDTLIQGLIDAATAYLDGHSGILGRALVTQTWSVSKPYFGLWRDLLPFPDVDASSVVITYQDEDDVERTVSADDYWVAEGARGTFVEYRDSFGYPSLEDRPDAVTFTFNVGFGGAAAVPKPIKQAILLLAAHWYVNREAVYVMNGEPASVPLGFEALCSAYRRRAW